MAEIRWINKNKSCIEICGLALLPVSHCRLIKTRVVLKLEVIDDERFYDKWLIKTRVVLKYAYWFF